MESPINRGNLTCVFMLSIYVLNMCIFEKRRMEIHEFHLFEHTAFQCVSAIITIP